MLRIILLLNPVYVTLFWSIVLSLNRNKNNAAKVFLGKVMMVAFVLYLSHFLFFTSQFGIYSYVDVFYTLASLSVHPLYYIYVLLLTRDQKFSLRKHSKFLLMPVVVFISLLVATVLLNETERAHYFTFVLTGRDTATGPEKLVYSIYMAGRVLFIVQVFVYLYLVNRQVSIHNSKILDYYSDVEEKSLQWVRVFNISYFLASLAGLVLALMGRERFFEHDIYLVFPSLVFSFLLFVISYLGNKQKPVSVEIHDVVSDPGEIEDSLPGNISRSLTELFEKEMFFLNKDFKIWDVSSRLGTNRTYISRVINQEFGVNFTTFVNNYRVEHVKKLLHENSRMQVEELADRSGFGSVNSLYRAFELKEKISLGTYRKTR